MRVPAASIVFSDEDIKEALSMIESSLRSGQLTLGKHGQAFEEAFAGRCGRKHAIAVEQRHQRARDRPPRARRRRQEVIVPDNTFFATAAAVAHAGATPVLADTDRETLAVRRRRRARPAHARRRARRRRRPHRRHRHARMPRLQAELKRSRPLPGRGCGPRPRQRRSAADDGWELRRRRDLLVLSDEGHHRPARAGMIVDRRRPHRRGSAHLPRPGQGRLHEQLPHAARRNWRLSEPHAAIGLVQLDAARRVHRPPPRSRVGLRPRRQSASASCRCRPPNSSTRATSTSSSPTCRRASTARSSSSRCASASRSA